MKLWLHTLFVDNWQRKTISTLLAIFIWFSVNHSLTSTRTVAGVPMRLINIPQGKIVEGLQVDGYLSKKISLSLVGNKDLLDDLTANDLEVVIDMGEKPAEWTGNINKKNLVSVNPDFDLVKGVSRVSHQNFTIRMTPQATE